MQELHTDTQRERKREKEKCEKEKEREINLLSAGSLSIWPSWPMLGEAKKLGRHTGSSRSP